MIVCLNSVCVCVCIYIYIYFTLRLFLVKRLRISNFWDIIKNFLDLKRWVGTTSCYEA